MEDIEISYAKELGKISRPFSPQLKARQWTDPIRELYRSKIAKIEALLYPVIGVDISSWQGTINWEILGRKVYFVIIRSGYGANGTDTEFQHNLKGAHDQGRAVGLYHYLKPDRDFKKTAQLFYDMWKDSDSHILPTFDMEETGGLDNNTLNGWYQKFLIRFSELAGKDEIFGQVYTSASYFNGFFRKGSSDWPKMMNLFVAHWTIADEPLLPLAWTQVANPRTWDYWQYSSKGDGKSYGVSSASIDLDRYHYSLSAFNQKYKLKLPPLDTTPPPPPTPSDKIHPLYQIEITADTLNARAGDGTTYTDIGNLLKGTHLPVTEENGDWVKSEFYFNKNYAKKL